MDIVPISPARIPARPLARGDARRPFALAATEVAEANATGLTGSVGAAEAPSRATHTSRAAFTQVPFEATARDTLQIERWHREWAQARASLVTQAYTALDRQGAGTLFDLAA